MAEQVVVGMSGGVDSAVAAYLLKDQGYDVQCVFMKNWEDDDDEFYCSSEEDYSDALQVCDLLDLSLHSVNFAKEYRENVFSYFLSEYKSGRTPNPDVLCNKEIKFKFFIDHAMKLGATRIATGHYAKIEKHNDDNYYLLKGIDGSKDQSYFLYLLGQKELSKAIFPLGDISKNEVRKIAKEHNFPNHDKKDSTGICFIGERDFKSFLQQYLPAKPGNIITSDGKIVGQHDGLMYYTLGQRKGIGVGGGHGKTEEPWYVVKKDLDKNNLVIGQGHDHPGLYSKNIKAGQLHWITSAPSIPFECTAKIRYRQKDQPCTITSIKNGIASISFTKNQFAPTPGQSVVFYNGKQCLGGGIIK